MEYLWLIAGFVLLIVGADIFVEGSSAIAKLFKIPTIIIGLTIVALGTSLPEASVSVSAALAGSNDIAISNVIGSNIFNLLVVLGASALICPVRVHSASIKKEIPFSIFVTVALGALLAIGISFDTEADVLMGMEIFEHAAFTLGIAGGAILLVFLALYMYWQIRGALKARKKGKIVDEPEDENKKIPTMMAVEMVILGIVGIIMGGNIVVENASVIAANFGMSQTLIGLTIVAIGTSLPELVTSMVAAKKGESDIALGNVIGSNVFNIVFILGFSAIISPMTVDVLAIYDTLVLLAVSVLTLVFAKTNKRFSRSEGAVMLAIYAIYFVYAILR
ncbi:MAG: calcium/sodium antiporter [Clostridia bacterium]|nr:calcium/sodium antiporter [Clostridia bacterium]